MMRPAGLVLAAILGATGAAAQPSPPPAEPAAPSIETAKLLLASGKLDAAAIVLERLHAAAPRDHEVLFLQAMLAEARGDLANAIARFRDILHDEPGNPRVRLELARAFFLKGDDTNAQRQFQLARAASLPPTVARNVDAYLAAIRARRSWAFSLSLAIAPDSNVNSATGARQVDIFGLPFDLSPGARATSGAGVAVDAAGEWAPRIGARARLRLGASLDSLDYRTAAFDDTTLAAYAGPKWFIGSWTFSPLVTASRRWYGGHGLYDGPGARIEVDETPTARLRLAAALDRQQLTYRLNPGQTGAVTSMTVDATYGLTPDSLGHLAVGVSRQGSRDRAYANTLTSVSVGYLRELPHGFSVSVEPGYAHAVYDAPLAAFGVRRRDDVARIALSVLNRRLALRGFAPRLSFSYARDWSSVPLYSYRRSRVELRLTRQF